MDNGIGYGMEKKAPLVRFAIDFDALHPPQERVELFFFFLGVCVRVCMAKS